MAELENIVRRGIKIFRGGKFDSFYLLVFSQNFRGGKFMWLCYYPHDCFEVVSPLEDNSLPSLCIPIPLTYFSKVDVEMDLVNKSVRLSLERTFSTIIAPFF